VRPRATGPPRQNGEENEGKAGGHKLKNKGGRTEKETNSVSSTNNGGHNTNPEPLEANDMPVSSGLAPRKKSGWYEGGEKVLVPVCGRGVPMVSCGVHWRDVT